MNRLFIVSLMLILSGCIDSSSFRFSATTTEPFDESCSQVVFGKNNCVLKDRVSSKADVSNSLIEKTTGVEDPMGFVSYIGFTIGIEF